MRCEEFRRLLDREGATAAEIGAEHLKACPSCQGELRRWREVEQELAAWGQEEAPPFLHERIMAHIRSEGRRVVRPAVVWWRPVWLMPVLLLVLLAGLGGLGLWRVLRPAAPAGESVTAADATARGDAPAARGDETPGGRAVVPAPPPASAPLVAQRQELPVERRSPKVAGQAKAVVVPPTRPPGEPGEMAAAAREPQGPGGVVADVVTLDRDRAPARPLGEMAEERKAAASLAAAVRREIRCQLLDDRSVPVTTLWLPEDAVPEAGRMWVVRVGEGGAVTVEDESATLLPQVASAIRTRAPQLPPPGRYRLTQAPLPEY